MGEAPFRLVAALLLVTHIVAAAFAFSLVLGSIPSWIARVIIIAISTRMFFVRDMDNSVYQEIIMVWCFFAAAVDLFWAYAWLDLGLDRASDWAGASTQLAAAFASTYAAKVHIPSNIMEDRRRFTALLLLVTHGVAFFFGAPFYPGFHWVVYLVGVALSARLFTTKVEDVNLALGTLAIITCFLLVAADVWVVVWSLTPREDEDLPRKWVMLFPNAVAAVASAYTAYTLVQDRKLLANILVTV